MWSGAERPGNLYDAVVSSQFDADRLDYMQRDRMMAGVRSSRLDRDLADRKTWRFRSSSPAPTTAQPNGGNPDARPESCSTWRRAIYFHCFSSIPTSYSTRPPVAAETVFIRSLDKAPGPAGRDGHGEQDWSDRRTTDSTFCGNPRFAGKCFGAGRRGVLGCGTVAGGGRGSGADCGWLAASGSRILCVRRYSAGAGGRRPRMSPGRSESQQGIKVASRCCHQMVAERSSRGKGPSWRSRRRSCSTRPQRATVQTVTMVHGACLEPAC